MTMTKEEFRDQLLSKLNPERKRKLRERFKQAGKRIPITLYTEEEVKAGLAQAEGAIKFEGTIEPEEGEALSWSKEDQEEIVQKLSEARLSTLLDVYGKHFKVVDKLGFTIILASTVAHCVPGEMLWLRVYGASRSGKTELLRAIAKHEDSTEMEVITPASIRGGLDEGHRLLGRINGKLVITKDFASMLTAKREARNQVFGLLRSVKDGTLTSDFGTEEGYISQESRFDWIIGTTPVFAQYKQMEDLLGARFIDLHWHTGNREDMAFQAMENNEEMLEIREEVAKAVGKLIDRAKDTQRLKAVELNEDTKKLIADWADLTALLRSPVARDYQHKVKFHPEPEVGTDLAQGFQRIAKGLVLLNIDHVEPHIARLSQDCISYERQGLIKQLVKDGSVKPIANSNLYYELEDLRLLGVCDKSDSDYHIKPELRDRVITLVFYWE